MKMRIFQLVKIDICLSAVRLFHLFPYVNGYLVSNRYPVSSQLRAYITRLCLLTATRLKNNIFAEMFQRNHNVPGSPSFCIVVGDSFQ